MFRPSKVMVAIGAFSVTILAAPREKNPTADDSVLLQKAKQIQRKIVSFDSHVDVPVDLDAATDGQSQFDLVKVERGHLSGAALAVFVPQAKRTPENYEKARSDAEAKYQTIVNVAKNNPNRAALAPPAK